MQRIFNLIVTQWISTIQNSLFLSNIAKKSPLDEKSPYLSFLILRIDLIIRKKKECRIKVLRNPIQASSNVYYEICPSSLLQGEHSSKQVVCQANNLRPLVTTYKQFLQQQPILKSLYHNCFPSKSQMFGFKNKCHLYRESQIT